LLSALALVPILVLVCASRLKPADEEPVNKEALAALNGSWRQTGGSGIEGSWEVTINDGTLNMRRDGGEYKRRYTFTLNPDANPPAIDLVLVEDVMDLTHLEPNSRWYGIYQLTEEGGKKVLKLSWGTERPREFGSGQYSLVLERVN
jgi:uncharacterized protein (TIGR03067 family)